MVVENVPIIGVKAPEFIIIKEGPLGNFLSVLIKA
jgi:hypothetical protein